MGIDAKGRNFSAPRLTPGRKHELMAYGSPAMIKDQDRQIAIMNDRARRYGYGMNASNIAKYGGMTARALGTNEGYRQPATNVRTMRNYSISGTKQNLTPGVKIFLIIFLIFCFGPVILPIIAVFFQLLSNL